MHENCSSDVTRLNRSKVNSGRISTTEPSSIYCSATDYDISTSGTVLIATYPTLIMEHVISDSLPSAPGTFIKCKIFHILCKYVPLLINNFALLIPRCTELFGISSSAFCLSTYLGTDYELMGDGALTFCVD